MAFVFYDVESLDNVFTVVTYHPKNDKLQDGKQNTSKLKVFYLDDDDLMGQNLVKDEKDPTKMVHMPQFLGTGTKKRPNPKFWSKEAMDKRTMENPVYETSIDAETGNIGWKTNGPMARPIAQSIISANPILATNEMQPLEIEIFDLRTPLGAYTFAREFLYRPDPTDLKSSKDGRAMREIRYTGNDSEVMDYTPEKWVVCDTDKKFDENPDDYPYILGYNSYNYDTSIIAYVFSRLFHLTNLSDEEILEGRGSKHGPAPIDLTEDAPGLSRTLTARDIRRVNDLMFTDEFRKSMPDVLRHIPQDPTAPGWEERVRREAANKLAQNKRFWGNQTYASLLREAMLTTGRHLDVARLNEKQSRVALKRLLGMMGYQILESSRLSGDKSHLDNLEDFLDLIAYNVSDVVYLASLFDDPVYRSQFELKSNMIKTYPELVFPYANPNNPMETATDGSKHAIVNRGMTLDRRLYADSSSQQLASRALCPSGALVDAPKVSLFYPHELSCKDGIKRRDILDESKEFFYTDVLPRIEANDPDEAARAKADFDHVYDAYRKLTEHNFDSGKTLGDTLEIDNTATSIVADFPTEFKNVPSTDEIVAYVRDKASHLAPNATTVDKIVAALSTIAPAKTDNPANPDDVKVQVRSALSRDANAQLSIAQVAVGLPYNIFYYDGEGKRTSCFATFSTGGVHGAEVALAAFEKDAGAHLAYNKNLAYLQESFGADDEGARKLRASVKTATTPISKLADGSDAEFPDHRDDHLVKEFLTNITLAGATWAKPKRAEIFETKEGGSNKLRDAYSWTSAAYVNHEDFSSYYPSLLRMMRVFYNDSLGYDRYGEIYADKERLGHLMKATDDADLRYRLGLDRAGVKLTLNTASGAGDAKFDNPVRMNNNIIAMRVIGQLFTWRIGQAQSLYGAKVISTNTDGLYTKLDREENDRLLAIEAAKIGIQIDPEPMYLISKDSNNRIEFDIVPCDESEAPIVGFDDNGDPIRATCDPRRGLTDKDGNPVPEGTPVKFKVLSVAGATLACREGTSPARSLAHSAATDWALSEYLMRSFARHGYRQSALAQPFDTALGEQIIKELHALGDSGELSDQVHGLTMFQNVIASNPASFTFTYTNTLSPDQLSLLSHLDHDEDASSFVTYDYYDNYGDLDTTMQHYNRIFVMKDPTDETTHLYDAVARVVPAATAASRKRKGLRQADARSKAARMVMEANSVNVTLLTSESAYEKRDIISRKHPGTEPSWNVLVENHDLWRLSKERIRQIYDNLDLGVYLDLLADAFASNWQNRI